MHPSPPLYLPTKNGRSFPIKPCSQIFKPLLVKIVKITMDATAVKSVTVDKYTTLHVIILRNRISSMSNCVDGH